MQSSLSGGSGGGGGLSESRLKRPFIIKGRKEETLLPVDDPHFDQSVETKVSFVQACNWFISFILIYESVKQFYYVFYYEGKCSDYSIVMIYYMLANVFWVIISFIGASLIRSKQAKRILIFLVLLIVALLSRVGIYFIMYGMMKSYISEATLADCMCSSIYVDELYMIQAIIEAIILLVMIIFVKIIHKYISEWEKKKTEFLFGNSTSSMAGGNSRLLRPNRFQQQQQQ